MDICCPKDWFCKLLRVQQWTTSSTGRQSIKQIIGVHEFIYNWKLFSYQILNTWLAPDIEKDDGEIRENNDSIDNDNSNHLSRALYEPDTVQEFPILLFSPFLGWRELQKVSAK